jgi:hypothetical protein
VNKPDHSTAAASPAPPAQPRGSWAGRVLLTALALNGLMMLVYLFFTMRMEFDSDFGAKNILASLMLQQGRFFPRGFGYWNDLWIIHGHVPLLLFIPLFGNNFLSNAMSSVVFAAVFLPLVHLFMRRLEVRSEAALLTTLVVACGFSEEWASFIYGQAAYGYVCLLLLLGLFAASEGMLAPRLSRARGLLLVGVCVLLGLYGTRLFVTLVFPAALGLYAARALGRSRQPGRRTIILACAALALGLLLRAWLTRGLVFHPFGSRWIRVADIPASGIWPAVVELFGLLAREPIPTDNRWSMVFPLRMAFAVALLLAAAAASRTPRATSDRRRFLIFAAWSGVAITAYLAVTIAVLVGKSRYLMPPLFAVVLVAGLTFDRMAASGFGRRLLALASLPLLGLSFVVYCAPLVPKDRGGVPWQGRYEHVRRVDQLITVLGELGVTRAYMSYEGSATLTVLSGSRIEARQVRFREGLPRPDPLLSYDRWYSDESPVKTALIVDSNNDAERAAFSLDKLTASLGPPVAVEERFGYLVVCYPSNVFPELPEWRKWNMEAGLRSTIRFLPSEAFSAPGVGRMEGGLLVSGDVAGALVYGPYLKLPSGRYRIRLSLTTQSDGVSPGTWDIALGQPPRILAGGALPTTSGERDFAVERLIDITPQQRGSPLEVRVFASGLGLVRYRETEIEHVDGTLDISSRRR